MQRTSVILAACVLACFGCQREVKGPAPVTLAQTRSNQSRPRFAHVEIDILDQATNRWFTDEQLYLRVQSSLHADVEILLPVNVGPDKGKKRMLRQTPFEHQPGKEETLLLEWLDDQALTASQRQVILQALENGSMIAVLGGQLYLTKKMDPMVVVSVKQLTKELLEPLVAEASIKSFRSFGKATYHVPNHAPAVFRDINPVTLHHQGRVKADIRIYYPRQANPYPG